MEVDLVIGVWELVIGLVVITSAFAANTHMTKRNTKELEDLKSNEISSLNKKCDEMMKESLARKEFVNQKLYDNEVSHLNKSMDELKNQSKEILEYVRR